MKRKLYGRTETCALVLALSGIALGAPPRPRRAVSADGVSYPGSTFTIAFGVNNSDQIVGQYGDATGNAHSFLFENGLYTNVDPPNARSSSAQGINDNGDIAGTYADFAGSTHGYLIHLGVFTAIDFPGAAATVVNRMNSSGDMVGTYGDSPQGPFHGFVLHAGVYKSIDPPGSAHTEAWGINDLGQIVGFYSLATGSSVYGFLLSNGAFANVPPPAGQTVVYPIDINRSGDIVGELGSSSFLLSGGNFTTLNYRQFPQAAAEGINDRGDIVGSYSGPNSSGPLGFFVK